MAPTIFTFISAISPEINFVRAVTFRCITVNYFAGSKHVHFSCNSASNQGVMRLRLGFRSNGGFRSGRRNEQYKFLQIFGCTRSKC